MEKWKIYLRIISNSLISFLFACSSSIWKSKFIQVGKLGIIVKIRLGSYKLVTSLSLVIEQYYVRKFVIILILVTDHSNKL